ncbi:cytidylyltransferase-like protein [Vibrio phage 1.031.O._10N.261.46.F8]|nr:cytidylyltransferase-like protein [Vibrio phage 1.031.O._10N.261.46.F8]
MSTKKTITVGFTCGSFDLCHYGHHLMFEEAKSQCDYLLVGLQTDPTIDRKDTKNKPIQNMEERLGQLKACKYIDGIVVYNTEEELLDYLTRSVDHIDVRFVGADWRGKEFTGYELPIPVIFNKRDHEYSTSYLRTRVVDAAGDQVKAK